MTTFERLEDCPPVERFIWNNVAISWGNFEGVCELTVQELFELKGLIEGQIYNKRYEQDTKGRD